MPVPASAAVGLHGRRSWLLGDLVDMADGMRTPCSRTLEGSDRRGNGACALADPALNPVRYYMRLG
jgi:hypothetical protein